MIVPPVGIGGGLVIFYKQSVQLCVLSQSPHLIDCKVSINEIYFYSSFMYGHPNQSLRHHVWESLERLGLTRRSQPWFIHGDFNEILGNDEKIGGSLRPEASFQDFRMMIRHCDFTDIPSVGNRFSWAGQRGSHLVQCCLDLAMGTKEYFDLFPASFSEFLEMGESDHRPLVCHLLFERDVPRRVFRFDSRCLNKDGFKDTVYRGWRGMGQSQLLRIPLVQRLSRCRQYISVWQKNNRMNAEERISILRRKLGNAMTSLGVTTRERNVIKEDLNQAYLDEEIYWKQKSIIMWLRSGDRNTRYFHGITRGK